MKTFLFIPLFAIPWWLAQNTVPLTHEISRSSSTSVVANERLGNSDDTSTSAIEALLNLSQKLRIPIGIIEDDERLCTKKISYSPTYTQAKAREGIASIVSQVPDYTEDLDVENNVIVVHPKNERNVTRPKHQE